MAQFRRIDSRIIKRVNNQQKFKENLDKFCEISCKHVLFI